MIFASNTPNNTGVVIRGDYMDFDALYTALHAIVGDEGQYSTYEGARIRVLGVCYEIRHALMGDREIEYVDNGLDDDKMRRLAKIAPNKNVYLSINVLWPEMLFVTMALNDFIMLHARRQAKNSYDLMVDKRNIWDQSIAQVRIFQAATATCIRETVSEASFSRMLGTMNSSYTWFNGYITQYVDLLNIRFLAMDKEKRLKSIPTMAKRLAEQGEEYHGLKEEIKAAAKEHNYQVDEIRLTLEYPDNIEW